MNKKPALLFFVVRTSNVSKTCRRFRNKIFDFVATKMRTTDLIIRSLKKYAYDLLVVDVPQRGRGSEAGMMILSEIASSRKLLNKKFKILVVSDQKNIKKTIKAFGLEEKVVLVITEDRLNFTTVENALKK